MTPTATVLIPAWNEAGVIARCLAGLADPQLHVIVIANGCHDATASIARSTLPRATVIETEHAGKTRALNLGYTHALPGLPVVCLDADLEVRSDDVLRLVAALGPANAACGRMVSDSASSSFAVRAYMRAWSLNPYFKKGKFGGLYALSARSARMIFPLPDVTADDEWVRRSFLPSDVAYVHECAFTARAPATLGALIKVRRRSLRGARAISASGVAMAGGARAMLGNALRQPARWGDVFVFLLVATVVRIQLLFASSDSTHGVWERDDTSRALQVYSDV